MKGTIEEVKEMRRRAEKEMERLLEEIAERGVYIGSIHASTTWTDKTGEMVLQESDTRAVKPRLLVKIMLHWQDKPE
jgi:hypothetical protein